MAQAILFIFESVFPNIPYIGELGFGFGRSDSVRLYNLEEDLEDQVSYTSEEPWTTCADETGNTLELISNQFVLCLKFYLFKSTLR